MYTHAVLANFEIGGTVAAFTSAAQLDFKSKLAGYLGNGVAAQDVTLAVSSGSVIVAATVSIASTSAADAAASQVSGASSDALSSALGVTVLAVPTVSTARVLLAAPSPPPPSPPPASPPTPPLLPAPPGEPPAPLPALPSPLAPAVLDDSSPPMLPPLDTDPDLVDPTELLDESGQVALSVGDMKLKLPMWAWVLCGVGAVATLVFTICIIMRCCRRRGGQQVKLHSVDSSPAMASPRQGKHEKQIKPVRGMKPGGTRSSGSGTTRVDPLGVALAMSAKQTASSKYERMDGGRSESAATLYSSRV